VVAWLRGCANEGCAKLHLRVARGQGGCAGWVERGHGGTLRVSLRVKGAALGGSRGVPQGMCRWV